MTEQQRKMFRIVMVVGMLFLCIWAVGNYFYSQKMFETMNVCRGICESENLVIEGVTPDFTCVCAGNVPGNYFYINPRTGTRTGGMKLT